MDFETILSLVLIVGFVTLLTHELFIQPTEAYKAKRAAKLKAYRDKHTNPSVYRPK